MHSKSSVGIPYEHVRNIPLLGYRCIPTGVRSRLGTRSEGACMKTRDKDLVMQMLEALDDPAAVITLSIMRYRGMPSEMAAIERPVLDFISEHFNTAADGTWPAKALEGYRASSSSDQRVTDPPFQLLFDW